MAIAERVAEYLRAEEDIWVEVEHPRIGLPVIEHQPYACLGPVLAPGLLNSLSDPVPTLSQRSIKE